MKKTNPLKIVEIENYANNLRKELGIPSNSFFPVLEVMEKFHVDGLLTIHYLKMILLLNIILLIILFM